MARAAGCVLLALLALTRASLFRAQVFDIPGDFGDYYVLSANAEDPFQSLEINVVCSERPTVLFSSKIENCAPETDIEETWHFHYNCDFDVVANDFDNTVSKRNVLHADSKFTYRRKFLISIGIDEGKFVLWNGDRRKPFKKDIYMRFQAKAEVSTNETKCKPDRLEIRGTIWNIKYSFIPGPETTTTTTTTTTTSTLSEAISFDFGTTKPSSEDKLSDLPTDPPLAVSPLVDFADPHSFDDAGFDKNPTTETIIIRPVNEPSHINVFGEKLAEAITETAGLVATTESSAASPTSPEAVLSSSPDPAPLDFFVEPSSTEMFSIDTTPAAVVTPLFLQPTTPLPDDAVENSE